MRVLTAVLVLVLLATLVTAQKKKGKKGRKPSKGKKPANDPFKPYRKYTKENTGGECWWDISRDDCAVCKPGFKACGFLDDDTPLHKWCYKSQVCPDMPTPQTRSTQGHPCFFDHSRTDCAWCTSPRMAQVGDRGSKASRKHNHCINQGSKKAPDARKVLRMEQSCKYFGQDICDSMAECNRKTGKCECKAGWTGNGIQCKDADGNFASKDNISIRMTMTNELFLSDGSLQFPVGPSQDNLFSEMESLANGAVYCSLNGCSYNRTSTNP